MKYSASKEVNQLVRKLVRAGWSFRRGGKHGKLYAPKSGMFLTVPTSPSDVRAVLNLEKDARRVAVLASVDPSVRASSFRPFAQVSALGSQKTCPAVHAHVDAARR